MKLVIIQFGEPKLKNWVSKEHLNNTPLKPDIDEVIMVQSPQDEMSIWREMNKFDLPDNYIVCIVNEWEGYNGYCITDRSTFNPLLIIAQKTISRRFLFFKNIMAKWVLDHEFGHAFGLDHCWNPFCIMCVPLNLSFGRFCGRCKRDLSKRNV